MSRVRLWTSVLMLCSVQSTAELLSNVAVGKTARLSATYGGTVSGRLASYAVDGDYTTSVGRCAEADVYGGSGNLWWQVDLAELFVIYSVTLYVSSDSTDNQHTKNFNIHVAASNSTDGTQPICASLGDTNIPDGGNMTFSCSSLLIGRYVTIRKTSIQSNLDFLTICEVVISAYSCNAACLAYRKPARQSKTFGGDVSGRLASYAVDGNYDTTDVDRCATAEVVGDSSWWQVDLGDEFVVYSVTLYVSTTESGYMNNFDIFVGADNSTDGSQPTCANVGVAHIPAGGNTTFNCNQPRAGRYVTIRKLGGPITMCEVALNNNLDIVTTDIAISDTATPPTTTSTTQTTTINSTLVSISLNTMRIVTTSDESVSDSATSRKLLTTQPFHELVTSTTSRLLPLKLHLNSVKQPSRRRAFKKRQRRLRQMSSHNRPTRRKFHIADRKQSASRHNHGFHVDAGILARG